MIQVSDKYKKAVKEQVRELDAFVEILVDAEYINATEESSTYPHIIANNQSEITNIESVSNDNSIYNKYFTLESSIEPYSRLDGTYILPNMNFDNERTGYIGAWGQESEIEIENLNSKKRCITLYLEEVYKKINVTIEAVYWRVASGSTYEYTTTETFEYDYTDNDKEIFTSDSVPLSITKDGYNWTFHHVSYVKIKIIPWIRQGSINVWDLKSNRIRIKHIVMGESLLFKDKEIISINVNEETDIYNLEVPDNDCSVVLNNYDRKFNVTDKNNVLNRLGKETIIKPYYGLSIDGYYNYQLMGCYSYESFVDNNNLDTTIKGIGSIQYLESENAYLSNMMSGYDDDVKWFSRFIFNQMSPYENNINYNGKVPARMTNFDNKREQAQALALFSNSYVKQLRIANTETGRNYVMLDTIQNEVKDTIYLSQQLEQPKFQKIIPTKTININYSSLGSLGQDDITIFEDNVIPEIITVEVDNLTVETYYRKTIYINSSSPIDANSIKVYVNGTQTTRFYYNEYSLYGIKMEISFDDVETKQVLITGKQYESKDVLETIQNNSVSEGATLDLNSNYLINNSDRKRVCDYIFKNEKVYEFEVEILGDPSLEIGDLISLETIDGYKLAIIQSIEFSYTGGLTAILKGVCSNAI